MSLYANYIKEREGKDIVESDEGFATFKMFDNGECYLQDIYVLPNMRQSGLATKMADEVISIAKKRGCHTLIGSVHTEDPNASKNMKIFLAYGLQIYKTSGPMIFLKKTLMENSNG